MQLYHLVFVCTSFLFANYLQRVNSLPAERPSSSEDQTKEDKRSSFLSEYLTIIGANDQNQPTPQTSPSFPNLPTLTNEAPTPVPIQVTAAPVQLHGAEAIEDAIHAALNLATGKLKTTKIPKRLPSSTDRFPQEMYLKDLRGTGNQAPQFLTAMYTDPIALLGLPTTLAPWSLPATPQYPGLGAQVDPVLSNYLSLMSPQDLLALQAYQEQLSVQNPVLQGELASEEMTSTTEATPGEYLGGFFGSLGAGNLGGMAENAFRFFASSPFQGFLVGLADQVTCQLGKNCKKTKLSRNETEKALLELSKLVKEASILK